MIHLDTSFLIRSLVRQTLEDRTLRAWLREGEPCAISAVPWAEFLCGPVADADAELARQVIGDPVPLH